MSTMPSTIANCERIAITWAVTTWTSRTELTGASGARSTSCASLPKSDWVEMWGSRVDQREAGAVGLERVELATATTSRFCSWAARCEPATSVAAGVPVTTLRHQEQVQRDAQEREPARARDWAPSSGRRTIDASKSSRSNKQPFTANSQM